MYVQVPKTIIRGSTPSSQNSHWLQILVGTNIMDSIENLYGKRQVTGYKYTHVRSVESLHDNTNMYRLLPRKACNISFVARGEAEGNIPLRGQQN